MDYSLNPECETEWNPEPITYQNFDGTNLAQHALKHYKFFSSAFCTNRQHKIKMSRSFAHYLFMWRRLF